MLVVRFFPHGLMLKKVKIFHWGQEEIVINDHTCELCSPNISIIFLQCICSRVSLCHKKMLKLFGKNRTDMFNKIIVSSLSALNSTVTKFSKTVLECLMLNNCLEAECVAFIAELLNFIFFPRKLNSFLHPLHNLRWYKQNMWKQRTV